MFVASCFPNSESLRNISVIGMEWRQARRTLGPAVLALMLLSAAVFVLFAGLSSTSHFAVVDPDSSAFDRAVAVGSPDNSSHLANQSSIVKTLPSYDDSNSEDDDDQESTPDSMEEKRGECDLFMGRWVRDARGSIYTNASCKMLPDLKNCGMYGKEQGYVYWRWRPDGCELPMFDPAAFLGMVRGKKLMFVGDSLARNQMESLLCLLSEAETPIDPFNVKTPTDAFKDVKIKNRTWYFPAYNFTLMVVWTEFLVDTTEIIINGTPSDTFNINLDKMNPTWAEKLPELDFVVINCGNWFTRRTYIHREGKLIGCVHCWNDKAIPSISVPDIIRIVFRAALMYITKCKDCQHDLLAVVRTYSMSHFEHGAWHSGGYCNRTEPLMESDLSMSHKAWEFRKIQIEEMGRVKMKNKKRFELMDITKAMMLRADAHPGRHWPGKTTSDCLHWCLPGPVDMWNELLLEIIKRNS